MKAVIYCSLLFILTATATAMAPPTIEWEELYDEILYDVHEIDNSFIIGSYNNLFLLDSQGDLIWSVTPDSINWYSAKFETVLPLSSGGFVIVGVGKQQQSSSYSMPLVKVNESGEVLWSHNYDLGDFTEYAYDVTELPDGGFAISATKDGDAWVLRTDSQGDTL